MSTALRVGDRIRAPISDEMTMLERELECIFSSEIGLISAIGRHLASTKGKRVRPALVLLSSKIGRPDPATSVKVAAAVEIIHTATLLHDDSIDRSHLRRGLPTVNKVWNDQVSVIMGDYLFCKAFKILHQAGLFDIASVLSEGSDSMTYGEMCQMDLRGMSDLSESAYLEIVKHKTASLFSSACVAGAILGGLAPEETTRLRQYGEHLGVAFQIVDDLLDYVGEVDLMGKPVGNDLRDGRATLPLIVAMRNAPRDRAARFESMVAAGGAGESDWKEIVEFITEHGGVEYSQEMAGYHAECARAEIGHLKPCAPTQALMMLADRLVSRKK